MALQDMRILNGLTVENGASEFRVTCYAGNPEGFVTAGMGSIVSDTTTGKLYKKSSGTGNTGWEEISGSEALTIFDWKNNVAVVATADITLSGLQTIDGVALAGGERVGVVGQATASDNGIYVAQEGAWVRAVDADSSADVTSGLAFAVTGGTAYKGALFVLTTADPITLGTTGLVFTHINPTYQNGNGINITGFTISVRLVSNGGLEFNSGEIQVNVDSTNNSTVINSAGEVAVNGYAKKSATLTGGLDSVDSVPFAEASMAQWLVVVKNGTTGRYAAIVFAVNLGTGTTADHNVSSILRVGTVVKPTFSVAVSAGNMVLQVTGTAGYEVEVTRIVNK